METITFNCPLVPGLVEQQCDHNAFCHRVFPALITESGEAIISDIQRSPQGAYEFFSWAINATNENYPLEPHRDVLLLSDIQVSITPLLGGTLLTVTLSPPTHTIGTYLIGLLEQEAAIRYFTLEMGYDDATILCEWAKASQHLNRGVGGAPTVEAFQERLKQHLTLSF